MRLSWVMCGLVQCNHKDGRGRQNSQRRRQEGENIGQRKKKIFEDFIQLAREM